MAIKRTLDTYTCEKCGRIYLNEQKAVDCCAPYHCECCGRETPRYILKCETCRRKEKYEKARKLTIQEYESEFPGYMLYDGSDFFADLDELVDHYEYNDCPLPMYVFGTFRVYGQLSPFAILKEIEDELDCEDLMFDQAAYDEFRAFAKTWNERHEIYCYHPCEDIVVLIPPIPVAEAQDD